VSASTAEFAVDTIVSWWQAEGQQAFPHAGRLLILADGGGSNGSRPRLWKARLQTGLADRFGLAVTVCHYPTGASHYNPIEHRLLGPISINWAGQPLRSLPLLLACIRGTKTETGLHVRASLNRKQYKTKIKVSDQEMRSLNLKRYKVCPIGTTPSSHFVARHTAIDPKQRRRLISLQSLSSRAGIVYFDGQGPAECWIAMPSTSRAT
jgi:hypothetical protein